MTIAALDNKAMYEESINQTLRDDLSSQPSNLTYTFNNMDSSNSTTTTADNAITQDFKFSLFGTYFQTTRWFTLPSLYSWLSALSAIAMNVGCVMPYVPQYITICKNRNCSGFSTYVCLILLLANISRLIFWFGHPFELPLFIQGIIMIIAQILLLELCVRVRRPMIEKKRSFLTSCKYFWGWTDLFSYIEFLCLFTLTLGLAMYFLIHCEPFVEAVGFCSLVTESMLGSPQVIKNFKSKSVEGMSSMMVLMWLAGDAFKTAYYIINQVPKQFWLCGSLQILIDIVILIQICLYRKNIDTAIEIPLSEECSKNIAL